MLFIALLFTACDETEPVIYDAQNGQTLVYFDSSSSTLEVLVDDTGSIDVVVGSSKLSTSDRTVSITVDMDNTTTDATNYSVPATVTIPANEYFGTFTVTGIDTTLETTTENLVLQLGSIEGGVTSTGKHSIAMYQICPVSAPFTGDYDLSILANGIFDTPTFTPGTVTLEVGSSALNRKFTVAPYPAFGAFPAREFNFSLTCNEIIVAAGQITGVGCGGTTTTIGPSPDVASYDPDDDSVFDMYYTDDEGGASCGEAVFAQVRFTKL